MAKSIMQTDKEHCYLCGRNSRADYFGLDEHHCIGGYGKRKLSEKYGLKVYLCHNDCHEYGENAVHQNAEVDLWLKEKAQEKAMEVYGWSIEDFIKIFGRNYL